MYVKTPEYFPFADYAKEKNKAYCPYELVNALAVNYGVERSMHLIVRTVQFKGSYEGRYYKSVHIRVDAFSFPDAYTEAAQETKKRGYEDFADKSRAYVSDVHPTILNDIFRELMKREQKQEQVHKVASEEVGGMPLG